MSLSTCLLESTWPTPNPVTSHFTSTKNQTIHLALSITFRNPSTNSCPKSRSMNVRLTKRHLSIRKPWMTADWMPNLKQKIDSNNKSTLQKMSTPPTSKACNCRRPADCPMTGDCLRSSVVYQATVTTEDSRPAQTYVGLTEICQSQIFC